MKTTSALRIVAIVMALGLVLFWVFSTTLWKWVPAGEVAIVYNANRGIDKSRVLTPGRYTLGPLDQLIMAPTHAVAAV